MRRILALSVVPIVVAALAGPASAEPSVSYHGEWDHVSDCAGGDDLAGTWNVVLRDGRDAVFHTTLFSLNQSEAPAGVPATVAPRNGDLHAVWTWPFTVLPRSGSDVFDLTMSLPTGTVLTMSLADSGVLTYTIVPLGACATVTITGHLTAP